jgi:hypothetical protein
MRLAAQVASRHGPAGPGSADGTDGEDETFTAGVDEGMRGRREGRKTFDVIAAREDGPGIARIRLWRIPDASAESLMPFMKETIHPRSTSTPPACSVYLPVEAAGYDHEVTFLKGEKKTASELMPPVHRVASLQERWPLGTHQQAVTQKRLDYYLDEFTFRFNRRRSANRRKLLYRLAQQTVAIDPVPYKSVVGCYAIAAGAEGAGHNL